MRSHFNVVFPNLQKTLSDSSDEVVLQCLIVIAEVLGKKISII